MDVPHRPEGEEPGGRRSIIVLLQLLFDLHSCAPQGILCIIDGNCSGMQRPLLDSGGNETGPDGSVSSCSASFGDKYHTHTSFVSNKDKTVFMLNMSVFCGVNLKGLRIKPCGTPPSL